SAMSAPAAIITRCTVWPLMSMPRISEAFGSASSGDLAIFTPPALPRPPVFTWALTTTTGVPSFSAPALAAAGSSATTPPSTGTPCFSKRSRAWYSYRSTGCFSSRCRQWAAGRTGLDATPGNTLSVSLLPLRPGRTAPGAGSLTRSALRIAGARAHRVQRDRDRCAVQPAAPGRRALDLRGLRPVGGDHLGPERRAVLLQRPPGPEPTTAAAGARRRRHPLPRGRPGR